MLYTTKNDRLVGAVNCILGNFSRRSVILAWLLSYISILFIPVIISSIVYIKSAKMLESEINNTNNSLLRQVQQVIDNKLQDVEKLSLQIGWNPRVIKLIHEKRSTYLIPEYGQVIRDLRVYRSANSLIDNFYIFLKSKGDALTSETLIPTEQLADYLKRYKDITAYDWDKILWNKHIKDYIPMSVNQDNGDVQKVVAFVRSLPVDDPNHINATLIIMVNSNNLLNTLRNTQWVKEGMVMVLDKDNNLLASTAPFELPKSLGYENMKKDNELLYYEINGQNYTLSYITSTVTSWKYVSIIPTRIFWQKTDYFRKVIYISVLLSIFLGGVLTFVFLRRNYSPVSKLVENFTKKTGMVPKNKFNEYKLIQEGILDTLGEKENISKALKQQRNLLKSSFLTKLLKGQIGSETQVFDALKSYDISFYSDSFAVMLFYIEDIGDLYSEDGKTNAFEKFKLARFILTNVIEEIVVKNNFGIMVEIDEMLACLINFKEDNINERHEELLRIAHEGQEFINQRFNILYSVSVSNINKTIEYIPKTYQEAFEAMEYKTVMGIEGVIFYNEIQLEIMNESQCSYYYPLQIEQQLTNFIKSGDFNKALAILNEIYDVNFRRSSLPLSIAKCLMFNLISTMIKTMYEISGLSESNFFENMKPVNRLFNCQTVPEMNQQMKEILKQVCEYVELKKKDDHGHLKDEVIAFIEKHYSDMNLNIPMIAEKFRITPAYLSKLFKEYSNEGLLDCINKIRLNNAKKLLKEQDISVSDIARMVGYYNSNAIIRAFKKYEGITPGRFKEMN